MPFSDVPYSLEKHGKGDFVEFPDVSKVKDKRIHSVLTDEGIQSLISIPMMDGDIAIGFIGFDRFRLVLIGFDFEISNYCLKK